jgi:hypothetical protein
MHLSSADLLTQLSVCREMEPLTDVNGTGTKIRVQGRDSAIDDRLTYIIVFCS